MRCLCYTVFSSLSLLLTSGDGGVDEEHLGSKIAGKSISQMGIALLSCENCISPRNASSVHFTYHP